MRRMIFGQPALLWAYSCMVNALLIFSLSVCLQGCESSRPRSIPSSTTSGPVRAEPPTTRHLWLRLELERPQQWWSRLGASNLLPSASPNKFAIAVTAALGLPARVAGRFDLRRAVLLDVSAHDGGVSWVMAFPVDSGRELAADLSLGSRALHRARPFQGGMLISPSPEGAVLGVAGKHLLVGTTAEALEQHGVRLARFARRTRGSRLSGGVSGSAWLGASTDGLSKVRELYAVSPGTERVLDRLLTSRRSRAGVALPGTIKFSENTNQIVLTFKTPVVDGVNVCPLLGVSLPSGGDDLALDGIALDGLVSAPRRYALRSARWQELAPEALMTVSDRKHELARLLRFWSQVPSMNKTCEVPQLALVGLPRGVALSLSSQGEFQVLFSQQMMQKVIRGDAWQGGSE